ncbi:MAG: hypothetical protein E7448_03700 [Ruminococcaceae bacterium]|nr:hypothetical protein [Oscillospiraceae bacterium]
MQSYSNICYCRKSGQCLDIHLPECEHFPVFLYFHGGGLTTGDKTACKPFAEYLTDRGIAVISADYRMYPNAKYPDFLQDAAAVTAWVFQNISQYGSANGIYIGGSSAGAYISQMLCFDERLLAKHGLSPADVSGFIHDAGQPTCHYNVLKERGLDSRRVIIDEAAPLYHIDGKHSYPSMLIIVSDNDMQNRYEQTMLLISTLKHFGCGGNVTLTVMHGTHCAYVNAQDEKGDSVFGKLIHSFIESRT